MTMTDDGRWHPPQPSSLERGRRRKVLSLTRKQANAIVSDGRIRPRVFFWW